MTQEQIDLLLKILEILKWPMIAIVALLLFRVPLATLINRIKGIKGGGYGFETDNATKQQETRGLLKSDKSKIETIEKGLNLFSEETRNIFQRSILLETEHDKIKDDKELISSLKNYSEALYLILHFERIYYHIFGSQIRLLNYLNSSFSENIASVKFIYDSAVKASADLSKYPYESYLAFLDSQNLVEIKEDDSIQITWLGRDFLKFMIQMGLSDLKPH